MELMVIALVLGSAALHPFRDLLIKGQSFPESAYLGVTGSWVIFAALQATLLNQTLTLPYEVWPLVAGSALGLFIYYLCVMLTLKAGDLSVYYPIIRSSPLAIVAIGYLFLERYYSPVTLMGIVLTLVGAIMIQYRRGAGLLQHPKLVLTATLAMIGSALYGLADSMAMQSIELAPFLFWVYTILTLAFTVFFTLSRPRKRPLSLQLFGCWRSTALQVLTSGALSYLSYVLILLAFQAGGEVAAVSATRQASIPISVLLGSLVLKEERLLARLAWSLLLAGGVVLVIIGG
jgi:drug/metabolite transporter (DMT)-like permease